MYKLYGLIVGISLLIRQFLLPNPFEKLSHPVTVEFSGILIIIPPLMLNIMAEPILYTITFAVVGIFYKKRSFPVLGSLLYLVFYAVHVGLLTLMVMAQFATWAIVLIIILYIVCNIALLSFINHRSAV